MLREDKRRCDRFQDLGLAGAMRAVGIQEMLAEIGRRLCQLGHAEGADRLDDVRAHRLEQVHGPLTGAVSPACTGRHGHRRVRGREFVRELLALRHRQHVVV
ncbi:hypothetical protein D9M68_884780 [compost metagenome]